MKAALATPFLGHLPLYPSSFLGYAAAVLKESYDLDVIDLNARIYYKNSLKFKEVLAQIDENQVVLDIYNFYPFYKELRINVANDYKRISWENYQAVYLTMPSWFVNLSTETILKLASLINRESPGSRIFFFGNCLGSWADENRLSDHKISIVHLNNLLEINPVTRPVNYDRLPNPIYESRNKYIFDILPFRLKHGCVWGKCRFCSLAKGWNAGYKERSAGKVFREIVDLIDRYRPKMLACNDNSINGGNLLAFCRYLTNLNTPWAAMARADLSEKEIKALQKAGCRLLYFGLESGSDKILQEINKGISSRQMSDFMKALCDNEIMPAPSLVVGFPGETEDDFAKSVQFILDHKNYFNILNLYPFMTTPASDFSLMRKESNPQTLIRLSALINVCADIGIKVCVGEQSAEYVFYKEIYPGCVNY